MENITRRGFVWLGAAAATGLLPVDAQAAVGHLSMRIVSAGFVFGGGGGKGVLTFRGARYPFTVGGIAFGIVIGLSEAELVGSASHLNSPNDLAGSYGGGGANLAVAGGGGVGQFSNSNGVILRLQSRQVGFKLSLAVNGFSISMV